MANTSLAGKCHSLSRAALSAATRKERKKHRVEDSEAGIKYYLPWLCLS